MLTFTKPNLDGQGYFSSTEDLIEYSEHSHLVQNALWETEQTNIKKDDDASATLYGQTYAAYMAPLLGPIVTQDSTANTTSLESRANGLSIGDRLLTDKSDIPALIENAKKAGEIYNSYFSTHQERSDLLQFVAETYDAVAEGPVALSVQVMGKNVDDAKTELGKTGGTVSYLTSEVFNTYIDTIENDPSATVVTGPQIRNAEGKLVTNWDEIDGSTLHIDIYPDEVIAERNGPLELNELYLSYPASNYNIGTYVTDPLHALRLGVPLITKPPTATPDCAAAFTTIAMTAVAEKMKEKGATAEEIQHVRDHFLSVVLVGRDAKLEQHVEGGVRFVGGTSGAKAIYESRQSSPHISDDAKSQYILEADGTNPVLIDNSLSAEKIEELASMYFNRGKSVGGQTCTRAGVVGLQDGVAYEAYRDAYIGHIAAMDEAALSGNWIGAHNPAAILGPTAKSAESLGDEIKQICDTFGVENVHGGHILHEMGSNAVMTPAVVEVSEDKIDALKAMLKSGEEKFYPIQFIFKVPTSEDGIRPDMQAFNEILSERPGRLTSAIHSEDLHILEKYVENVQEGSVNFNNDKKGTSDNTSIGGHLCHVEGISNNGPTGTPAQTLHWYKGPVQNPITSIFLGASNAERQKQQIYRLYGPDVLEGESPNLEY